MMFIYVAGGSGGLVKVGQTSNNPKQRRRGLEIVFREQGETIVDFAFFEAAGFGLVHNIDERLLIEYMNSHSEVAFGKEWFRGVPFDVAAKEADRISWECLQKKAYMKWRDEQKLLSEYRKKREKSESAKTPQRVMEWTFHEILGWGRDWP